MDYQSIKKVHVVYKTHLDIGFTDMGENVIRQYMEKHIPHSINLAMELNMPERKKFIWTLGSYLIDYYLKNASLSGRGISAGTGCPAPPTASCWTRICSGMASKSGNGWTSGLAGIPLPRK